MYPASKSKRAGQAFKKKLCISVFKPFDVMLLGPDWVPSEVLFLVSPLTTGATSY